jgi:hypothetical protein
MTWPALGAAVIIVPEVAVGGGVGLFVRKSGWIWSSIDAVLCRDIGREKFTGLDDNDVKLWCGDCGRNGPSSVLSGEFGRLPGIASKVTRTEFGED